MHSSNKIYYSRIDHLRFIAVLLVIFWHTVYQFGLPNPYVPSFWPLSIFNEGHTGVALFMTLSGFIFELLVGGEKINYRIFIFNRFLRIAPLFLIWTFLLFWTKDIDPIKFFLALVGFLNKPNTLGIGWAVMVEVQFYLIFPFLTIFFKSKGWRYLVTLIFLAILMRAGIWITQNTVQEITYWSIFGRIDNFLIGMLCCSLYRLKKTFASNPYILLLLISTLLAYYHWFNLMGGYESNHGHSESWIWIFMPSIEGALYGLITAQYLSVSCSLPRTVDRIFAWMGAISFSLYMNHLFVLSILKNLLLRNDINLSGYKGGIIFFIATLFFSIPISVLTYRLIEEPFLNLRKAYLKK